MNRKLFGFLSMIMVAAFVVVSGIASAAVTFDAETGTGFVGKGDVQLALGLNNKQLQDQAELLDFTYESVAVSEATWTCDRDAGPQTQERSTITTTTTQGVVDTVARERNQITGFILQGFADDDFGTKTETEGPALWDCPTNWTAIDKVEGEPEVVSGGLYVNGALLSQ
jgi:hypothetical protein